MKGRGEIVGFPSGYFSIHNKDNGNMLDVKDGSTADGAPVVLADTELDSIIDSQVWKYDSGFIVNANSGLCLEVKDAVAGSLIKPGSVIVQSARRQQPDSFNQLWAYNREFLVPYDSKVCVSGKDGKTEAGTELVADPQVDFPDNPRQQWTFSLIHGFE
jgi:hypothetical protein